MCVCVGGEASGVLCGEPSAPLRRCHQSPIYTELAPPPAPEPEPSPSRNNIKVSRHPAHYISLGIHKVSIYLFAPTISGLILLGAGV